MLGSAVGFGEVRNEGRNVDFDDSNEVGRLEGSGLGNEVGLTKRNNVDF
jgi:hypothetical protein